MLLTYFKRRKYLRKANALELTPITRLQSETGVDGLVTVFIPKFKNKRVASFVLPGTKSNIIRLKLDVNGSKVWNAIDGSSNIADISRMLKEKSTDDFPQAEERVAKFLLRIYQDRFITFKEIQAIK
jgi:hypothetical protein